MGLAAAAALHLLLFPAASLVPFYVPLGIASRAQLTKSVIVDRKCVCSPARALPQSNTSLEIKRVVEREREREREKFTV